MKKRILANDGLHSAAVKKLVDSGFEVVQEKIPNEKLASSINEYDAIVVRSATKIRKPLIKQMKRPSFIGRAGVGLDNIDVDVAKEHDITVANTPNASSRSVAELTMAHLLTLSRNLHQSNREMPEKGNSEFKALKKKYSSGVEIKDKTLLIIGFGSIGQETAALALGMGMRVKAVDPYIEGADVMLDINHKNCDDLILYIKTEPLKEVLSDADYISFHVPGQEIFGEEELQQCKDGVILINCSRGGVINEEALLSAINSKKVRGAGLDVYNNEPDPCDKVLSTTQISLTPHIGGSTGEAQEKIGIEMADLIIEHFKA